MIFCYTVHTVAMRSGSAVARIILHSRNIIRLTTWGNSFCGCNWLIGRQPRVFAGPAGAGSGFEEWQVGGKTFLCLICWYQRRKDFLPTCRIRDLSDGYGRGGGCFSQFHSALPPFFPSLRFRCPFLCGGCDWLIGRMSHVNLPSFKKVSSKYQFVTLHKIPRNNTVLSPPPQVLRVKWKWCQEKEITFPGHKWDCRELRCPNLTITFNSINKSNKQLFSRDVIL
jgi:hypothetical protein